MRRSPARVQVMEDRPGSEVLEELVTAIGREVIQLRSATKDEAIIILADLVREGFNLTVPVINGLRPALEACGILIENGPLAGSVKGAFSYSEASQGWLILLKPNLEKSETVTLLHEFYEILFWRCYHRLGWWRGWADSMGMGNPHCQADEFGRRVALPAMGFRKLASKLKLNVWKLSDYLQVSPGDCFNAIGRMTLSFDYFQAHLGSPRHVLQCRLELFYEDVEMKVQSKHYRPGRRFHLDQPLVDQAARLFPKRHSILPLNGVILDAVSTRQTLIIETRDILRKQLDGPVCVVVRPSPLWAHQAFVQIIPLEFSGRLCGEGERMTRPNPPQRWENDALQEWEEVDPFAEV